MAFFKRVIGVFALILILLVSHLPIIAQGAENLDDLYIQIGDAIMKTKESDWNSVLESMNQFEQDWDQIKSTEYQNAVNVEKSLKHVQSELAKTEKDPNNISMALSSLSKDLEAYNKEMNPIDPKAERLKLKALFPYLDKLEKSIQENDWNSAKGQFQQLLTNWTSNEIIVRNQSVGSYGKIETQLSLIRIAINQTPPDQTKALNSLEEMSNAITDFMNGKISNQPSSEEYSLKDVISFLEKSSSALEENNKIKASESLNEVLLIWPAVEGEVRTKNHHLYTKIENKIPEAISLLNSQNSDITKAKDIIKDLNQELLLLSNKTGYTYIDALLILLREGLEALLIITGLLAFLKKTNHANKQMWIWSGVFGGIIASAILAVIMNVFFSKVTAAFSREYIEGIIGLVAVIMMLTVGSWLHKKSNIAHWNQFIKKSLGNALAKGSLISMAFLSFLSIFREGAETIIFYAGMAPSMEISELVLGILLAIGILIILGFFIIRYSAFIPMRPFFVVATLLIYVLAFKMLGVSVHALQVANSIPVHPISSLPYFEEIGFFPTWETILPQLVLVMIILGTTMFVNITSRSQKHAIAK